ncbi:MAG: cobalt/nickel transport protein [Actinomycetota bacterium]|nr:cobalt/nickel transport protein [Actinomycetota bacterium]
MTRRRLADLLLVAGIVALFAVPLALRPGVPADSGGESYAGTDSVASELVEKSGYTPWYEPVFEPSSPEVESGLFALQAAAGAGALGFVLGRLSARRRTPPDEG